MAQCPICNNEVEQGASRCPACGFQLHEGTQQFTAVTVSAATPEPAVAAVPASCPTLTVQYGRQEGIVYELSGDSATVGRAPQCDVFLNDMTVSRKHAKLERVGEDWSIQDDGSFNGVWVNNKNIDHVMLSDGDFIQIGCFVLKYAK